MALGIRGRVGVAAGAVGFVGAHVAAAAFFAGHDPYEVTVFPPCPILAFTGWQCPACGGTRAAASLLRGDVGQSLAMNPLVVVLYLVAALVVTGLAIASRRPKLSSALIWAVPVVLGVTVLYTGLVRNLLPG